MQPDVGGSSEWPELGRGMNWVDRLRRGTRADERPLSGWRAVALSVVMGGLLRGLSVAPRFRHNLCHAVNSSRTILDKRNGRGSKMPQFSS